MSYSGQKKAGKAAAEQGQRARELGEFEAQQIEANALTERAAAQRTAMEEERQSNLATSRALVVAAASGGGASDPTVQKIIADVAGIGAYRKSVALYEGEERARQMRLAAMARRMEGEAGYQGGQSAQQAYNTLSYGSLATGAGRIGTSLYEKYGGPGPDKTTDGQAPITGYNQDAGLPGLGGYA